MTDSLRVIFAGTPEFAAHALAAIHAAGFVVPLVLTQPDRPAGRGMKLSPSAVKRFAVEHAIPVAQPVSLRLDGKYPEDARAAQAALQSTPHDVMVVAAYGLILPQWVLDTPRHGCLNIHASLLPRWRGAAPIHRAIEAGDRETGVTLMQMDAGLDTGAMISRTTVPIAADMSTAVLHDKLADVGATDIVAALHALARTGVLAATPQPAEGVTYAEKIAKAEAAIDWQRDAQTLLRRILAFDPFPGASSTLNDVAIKCWSAELAPGAVSDAAPGAVSDATPGTVLSVAPDGIVVACGADAAGHATALRLLSAQKPGGKRLPVREFLSGIDIQPGQRFG